MSLRAKVGKQDPSFKESVERAEVLRLRDGKITSCIAPLARESPLTIFVNDREVITLVCLGDYLENLAVGFLVSEGILSKRSQLKEVKVDSARGEARINTAEDISLPHDLFLKRTLTSGCGKGASFYYALDALTTRKISSKLAIRAEQIFSLMRELNSRSTLYRMTGGVHNSALASTGKILIFREDIGRHNSVDKICGECFMRGIPMKDKIILSSGRITSEILIKVARLGIPMFVSRGAATTLAKELASKLNITTVGFARSSAFTVYAGKERIVFQST